MGMAEYEEGLRLAQGFLGQSDFQSQPPERVQRAEEVLGIRFPPTYRRFLLELGAGGLGSEEIYGVFSDDFESAGHPSAISYTLELRNEGRIADDLVVVYGLGNGTEYGLATGRAGADGEAPVVGFIPGLSHPSDDLEIVFPDFGCFFLDTIKFELENL